MTDFSNHRFFQIPDGYYESGGQIYRRGKKTDEICVLVSAIGMWSHQFDYYLDAQERFMYDRNIILAILNGMKREDLVQTKYHSADVEDYITELNHYLFDFYYDLVNEHDLVGKMDCESIEDFYQEGNLKVECVPVGRQFYIENSNWGEFETLIILDQVHVAPHPEDSK